jgi:mannose-6-phosphate isomerase-like protein (cupin superfamily)
MNGTDANIEIVQAWHDALNSGDLDGLTALMHDDIAFGGPRGEGRGAAGVREWAERSGIRLEPDRWFANDDWVVVGQRARWPDPAVGGLTAPDPIASAFQLSDSRVQRVIRHGSLSEALAAIRMEAASHGIATLQIVTMADLPSAGWSSDFEGYLCGDAPISIIFVDVPPGGGPRLHRHPYLELFIVHEGTATFTVGDTTYDVAAGQIVIGPADVPHAFVNTGTGPLRQTDIHCNDRFVTEWLDE